MAHRSIRIAAAAAVTAVAGTALAQTPQVEGRLCGVEWTETTHGGDVLNSHGVLTLGPKMPQQGGGFMMMGQGTVEVKYIVNDDCRVASGSPFNAKMQVIAMSEDGATVDITMIPVDSEFEVAFSCPATVGLMHTKAGVSAPPDVSLPAREGASTTYRDGNARAGANGTISLKYCRP